MTSPILPIRRNLQFKLPKDKVSHWNDNHIHVSHFYNTLSIFFPVGERFFIDSVRHYRDQIKDPQLQEAVTAFIGQEAMHGREHDEYNEALDQAGLPAKRFEGLVTQLLNRVQKTMPPSVNLATTIALEHWTAILADVLLREPELLSNADSRFAALWQWHALEETEHKGVAFDVFEAVMGKGLRAYLLRTSTQLLATAVFWPLVYVFYYQMLRQEGEHRNLKGWAKSLSHQWGSPGALRQTLLPLFEYFRPGFHPWQQDNREFLERLEGLVQQVQSYEATAESAA